ncbi:MAG TPA: NnrU family protein [Burkholderiales bacterium]|jgi:uncharacterized membrane protein|nr:NnrU family protein [Burkholderiales bacterium]
MGLLVLGLAVFFSVHLMSSFRDARDTLIARYGEKPYKAGYALLSAIGLALIVWGKIQADPVPLWQPPAWSRSLALWLMPLAFILLVGAYVPSNLRRLTAHPMLWAVTLWAVLHLLANGDLGSVLLFGAFALYSLYAMWSQTQRGAKPGDTVRPVSRDIAVVALGLAVYGAALYGHRWLSGVTLV